MTTRIMSATGGLIVGMPEKHVLEFSFSPRGPPRPARPARSVSMGDLVSKFNDQFSVVSKGLAFRRNAIVTYARSAISALDVRSVDLGSEIYTALKNDPSLRKVSISTASPPPVGIAPLPKPRGKPKTVINPIRPPKTLPPQVVTPPETKESSSVDASQTTSISEISNDSISEYHNDFEKADDSDELPEEVIRNAILSYSPMCGDGWMEQIRGGPVSRRASFDSIENLSIGYTPLPPDEVYSTANGMPVYVDNTPPSSIIPSEPSCDSVDSFVGIDANPINLFD